MKSIKFVWKHTVHKAFIMCKQDKDIFVFMNQIAFKILGHKSPSIKNSCCNPSMQSEEALKKKKKNHLVLLWFVVGRTPLETQTVPIGCIFHSVCCRLLPLGGLRYHSCCSNTVKLNFKVSHLPDPATFPCSHLRVTLRLANGARKSSL